MTANQQAATEALIMAARRDQPMPPTPMNPAKERLMYTGETPEEFYARRQPMESLWNGFMAGVSRLQFPAPQPASQETS